MEQKEIWRLLVKLVGFEAVDLQGFYISLWEVYHESANMLRL